jgi:hypothetical protein
VVLFSTQLLVPKICFSWLKLASLTFSSWRHECFKNNSNKCLNILHLSISLIQHVSWPCFCFQSFFPPNVYKLLLHSSCYIKKGVSQPQSIAQAHGCLEAA